MSKAQEASTCLQLHITFYVYHSVCFYKFSSLSLENLPAIAQIALCIDQNHYDDRALHPIVFISSPPQAISNKISYNILQYGKCQFPQSYVYSENKIIFNKLDCCHVWCGSVVECWPAKQRVAGSIPS